MDAADILTILTDRNNPTPKEGNIMNTIKTTNGLAAKLSRFLIKDFGWQKRTLTRKEAAYLLNEKHSEANSKGVQLSIIKDETSRTLYLGKAFDSSMMQGNFKRLSLGKDTALETVIYFAQSSDDFPSIVVEVSDVPKPVKPTKTGTLATI